MSTYSEQNMLTERQARLVVIGFGAALVSGVAVAAFYRGADLVEVGAILLFLPVLVGLAVADARGGAIAAVFASGVYLVARFSTLGGLPPGGFVATAVVRTLLYLALGVFGGWANGLLGRALRKLELYDGIDDDTGVGNVRALLTTLRRERTRAERYGQVFSVAIVAVDRRGLDARRPGASALRHLAATFEGAVRTSDLVHRVRFDDREELVLVLAGTARSGAAQLARRLTDTAEDDLARCGLDAAVTTRVIGYPTDAPDLDRYESTVRAGAEAGHLRVGGPAANAAAS